MTNRNRTTSVLNILRRRVVRQRLDTYVNGEQTPGARRETARLIEHDESVYAEYLRVRDADRALRADLALVGRPERSQLERSFAQIGAALNGRAPLYNLRLRRLSDWRTSLVAVVLAALMLVPVAIGVNRVAAIGIATQPKPPITVADGITPTGETAGDSPLETLTPGLATAKVVTRATPTAPDTE